jgi:hypothetical protein
MGYRLASYHFIALHLLLTLLIIHPAAEEQLTASMWMHERQHTSQTMAQVMTASRE